MRKIYKDSVLFRKVLYTEHFVHYDNFGTQDDKHKFEYDITLYKCYTLSGRVYQIQIPNCTMNDKNIGRLVTSAIEYAATEFPQNFRLKDELIRKGIWRTL